MSTTDRLIKAASRVASNAPVQRQQYVSSALIYWPLIIELGAALDAAGIEWRHA